MFAVSKSTIEFNGCFFKVMASLVDVLIKKLDSVIELALFTVKDLQAQFLLLNFLFTASLVSFELINSILLLFLDVMLIGNI